MTQGRAGKAYCVAVGGGSYVRGFANEPGKFWGIVSETLFSFRFDENWNAAFKGMLQNCRKTMV